MVLAVVAVKLEVVVEVVVEVEVEVQLEPVGEVAVAALLEPVGAGVAGVAVVAPRFGSDVDASKHLPVRPEGLTAACPGPAVRRPCEFIGGSRPLLETILTTRPHRRMHTPIEVQVFVKTGRMSSRSRRIGRSTMT